MASGGSFPLAAADQRPGPRTGSRRPGLTSVRWVAAGQDEATDSHIRWAKIKGVGRAIDKIVRSYDEVCNPLPLKSTLDPKP